MPKLAAVLGLKRSLASRFFFSNMSPHHRLNVERREMIGVMSIWAFSGSVALVWAIFTVKVNFVRFSSLALSVTNVNGRKN